MRESTEEGRRERPWLGIAIVVAVLVTLSFVFPSAMIVTAPALVVTGFYLIRAAPDPADRAVGAAAITVGVLLLALLTFGVLVLSTLEGRTGT